MEMFNCANSTKFFTFFLIWPNIQIICVGSLVEGLLGAPELKIIGKVFTVFIVLKIYVSFFQSWFYCKIMKKNTQEMITTNIILDFKFDA